MTVKEVKRGKHKGEWAVVHTHGDKAGEVIAYHPTKDKALAQHRAIEASKARRAEAKQDEGEFRGSRRLIDGEQYVYHGWASSKRTATREADALRERGYKVRVIKTGHKDTRERRWRIYKRR